MSMTLKQAAAETQDRVIRAVKLHKMQNDPDGALKLLNPILEVFDREIPAWKSGVYTFQEPLELRMHKMLSQDETTPPDCHGAPVNLAFNVRGSILIDKGDLLGAAEALYKAVGYNPASAMVIGEFAEVFKLGRDLEQFEYWTRNAIAVNLHAAQIAKSYRNMGYLLIERREFEDAAAFYHLSKLYDPKNPTTDHELGFIKEASGKEIPDPGLEACYETCKKYDLPLGPDGAVRGLIRGMAMAFLSAGRTDLAKPLTDRLLELHPGADLDHLMESRNESNFDPDDQLNYLLRRKK